MWEPQRLATLWASMACYRDTFTFYLITLILPGIIFVMFEYKVLRRTFGPTRDKVTAGWRKLHNKGRHSLYSSPHIRRIRLAGNEARTG
jgi:hypothetical protein